MIKEKLSLKDISSCLKVVADPNRFLMLKLLTKRAFCVCEFVEMLSISQPAVSQHLRKLKEQGLLIEERKEQWRYFSLNERSSYYPIIQDLLEHSDDQDERYLQALDREGLAKC
ncbi:metalloregulator ArsR/SmtB family transcription factor [Shouchella sp. 1P09AA]|uniref:ArsR/SmtB family transcription factor n=1 Tax=Bacillaceae TaxID=186817 RepID=UPI0020D143D4|nr:metalloregulator ArsR/SmtB family transcription factor [Alkalihalobacillus sp. LMS6]UTR06717.1 metalloregulator ArsR/SmtB family transcription factor [Alkalihalobacillus sp. LMS6]